MKAPLHVLGIFFLVAGCGQSDDSGKRSSHVYIDGEKVAGQLPGHADSLISEEDLRTITSGEHGSYSEGIVPIIENPIQVIDSIFTDYVDYQESTDSDENKKTLTHALHQLDSNLNEGDLTTIVNVWLYYDPTDFPARELTEQVLLRNRETGIAAVHARMKNKQDWERQDSAPFSELNLLMDRLESNSYKN